MNKHVNKVRKATGRAEAITADRQQNKQQYLIIQIMKKKESIESYSPVVKNFLQGNVLMRKQICELIILIPTSSVVPFWI